MKSITKHSVSDWTVITLGSIGTLLGLMGLVNPSSQLDMLGLQASDGTFGKVIHGLLTSSSVSAIYIGILYIFGVIKRWPGFKHYLVFTRILMCTGFIVLLCTGNTVDTFKSAAMWEGFGGLIILISLAWDTRKKSTNFSN